MTENIQKTKPHSNEDIANRLIDNIEDILVKFDVQFKVSGSKIVSNCPIHLGDNSQALNIYIDNKFQYGNWKCWTHHCEEKFGYNIFGFIRGLLYSNNKPSEFKDAMKWISDYLGEKIVFGSTSNRVIVPKKIDKYGFEQKKDIKTKLIIPPKYYLDRGFEASTLRYFDVGLCLIRGPLFQRVVVPIYSQDKNTVLGLVSRTTQPECNKCKYHHYYNRACPQNDLERFWGAKWLNNKGFYRADCFYNYWNASEYIRKSELAILVEGQGDVWRLHEAGIYNALGMFGCEITDQQMKILANSGVKELLVLTDNDEAGIIARDKIVHKCKNLYKVRFKDLPTKDIGDMSVIQVRELFKSK